MSPAEDLQDVPDSRPRGGCNHGDAGGKEGQGTFSLLVEQSLPGKASLAFLQHCKDLALAGQDHAAHNDLVISPSGIDG